MKYVTPSGEIYLNFFLRFENRYRTFYSDFDPFQGKERLITVYVVALLGITKNENTNLKKTVINIIENVCVIFHYLSKTKTGLAILKTKLECECECTTHCTFMALYCIGSCLD